MLTTLADRPCRVCGAAVPSALDLGCLTISAFPTRAEIDAAQTDRAPLDLGQCEACGLVQAK